MTGPPSEESPAVESRANLVQQNGKVASQDTSFRPPLQPCDRAAPHEGPLPFGVSRIVTTADGRYRLYPSGDRAVIVPVRDRYGGLCDLVAWFPDQPQRWWLRICEATPILGTQALALAAAEGGCIKLHGTPERWLIANGPGCIRPPGACVGECAVCELPRGACVLRWDVPLAELFEGVGQVTCNSPELERRLLQALRGWEPRVTVARRETRRAA